MKILLDGNATLHKNLHVAISEECKYNGLKKENGKYPFSEGLRQTLLHMIMSSFVQDINDVTVGISDYEVILTIDSHGKPGNWRKDGYPEYKANRKKDDTDPIPWDGIYEFYSELHNKITECFSWKVLYKQRLEGDDIILLLADYFASIGEPVTIVGIDKDFIQGLEINQKNGNSLVRLYNNGAKKKKFISMTEDELAAWKLEHVLLGDASDGVPKVISETLFSDNFKSYLIENGVELEDDNTDVYNVQKLPEFSQLLEAYEVPFINRAKNPDGFDVYKRPGFGPAALKKFLATDWEKINPLYKIHVDRNEKLVLFENIPSNLREECIEQYENIEDTYDYEQIKLFFREEGLRKFDTTPFQVQEELGADW